MKKAEFEAILKSVMKEAGNTIDEHLEIVESAQNLTEEEIQELTEEDVQAIEESIQYLQDFVAEATTEDMEVFNKDALLIFESVLDEEEELEKEEPEEEMTAESALIGCIELIVESVESDSDISEEMVEEAAKILEELIAEGYEFELTEDEVGFLSEAYASVNGLEEIITEASLMKNIKKKGVVQSVKDRLKAVKKLNSGSANKIRANKANFDKKKFGQSAGKKFGVLSKFLDSQKKNPNETISNTFKGANKANKAGVSGLIDVLKGKSAAKRAKKYSK
jgi:hypothetical protein